MRTLLKFPTRGRPAIFFDTLERYMNTAIGPLRVIVTVDANDSAMQPHHQRIRDLGCELDIRRGSGKVAAINSGIPADGWDILVLGSDDHIPVQAGWDTIIRQAFAMHFPDFDGSFWFKDKRQLDKYGYERINMMPILGNAYYKRFGCIYHPSYFSLYPDDEQTAIGLRDGKLKKIPIELFRNEMYMHGGSHKVDKLYTHNNSFWKRDKANFEDREKRGFPYP